MASAITVGDYITAAGRGAFTPMHVLKLAYVSHGYALAITGRPLFPDRIEAWRYGPVIPRLYHAIKKHGSSAIPRLHACGTRVGGPGITGRMGELRQEFDGDHLAVMDRVVDVYGSHTGIELSDITHGDGTPWRSHYVEGQVHAEIPGPSLMAYYRGLAGGMGGAMTGDALAAALERIRPEYYGGPAGRGDAEITGLFAPYADGLSKGAPGGTYGVVLERDEDGVVVADVPSLPGCHTQGGTEVQAMERVREAIWSHTGVEPGDIVRIG